MPAVRSGWLSRSGRYYAWVIAVFYAALLGIVRYRGADGVAMLVVRLALTTISGAGVLVAVAAARDLDLEERNLGLERTESARGVPRAFREPARLFATMAVVAVAVML